MKQTLALCSLLGATLISACATQPSPAVEIVGLDAFSTPCPTEPPVLTDDQINALLAQYPDATARERYFWIPRDQAHRACELYERARADSLLALGARYNQAVRGRH